MAELARVCSEYLGMLLGLLFICVAVLAMDLIELPKRKPKAKAGETIDPFVAKAMEELDDIDRALGLLPPKPEPKPTTRQLLELEVKRQLEHVKRLQELEAKQSFWQNSYLQECHCLVCGEPGIHTHMVQEETVMCDDGTS